LQSKLEEHIMLFKKKSDWFIIKIDLYNTY
jgi:hypothetical protein